METPPANFTLVEEVEEKEALGYINRINLKEGDMNAMNALGQVLHIIWPLPQPSYSATTDHISLKNNNNNNNNYK